MAMKKRVVFEMHPINIHDDRFVDVDINARLITVIQNQQNHGYVAIFMTRVEELNG